MKETAGSLIAINLGPRKLTVTVTGLAINDAVLISPLTPVPDGYVVGAPTARAANTLDVPVYGPLIAINQTLTFKARILALRP